LQPKGSKYNVSGSHHSNKRFISSALTGILWAVGTVEQVNARGPAVSPTMVIRLPQGMLADVTRRPRLEGSAKKAAEASTWKQEKQIESNE
jgi:hypothetical protein